MFNTAVTYKNWAFTVYKVDGALWFPLEPISIRLELDDVRGDMLCYVDKWAVMSLTMGTEASKGDIIVPKGEIIALAQESTVDEAKEFIKWLEESVEDEVQALELMEQ
ncbi:Bro-N domain-containing protein [Pleionea sp. CnH1-48]|uniref:Bro-N domain-containing protein n=1 Tax=Pleionea sp. CnH1-48 TaxID=2954494 RepID=UPI0020979B49|nr:Bro-N domain-containing protein [Pleionea sp. CnH1-48]MCO7223211.1 Bro-N domain-containing protein [Pleionea sp. CnH1-48]